MVDLRPDAPLVWLYFVAAVATGTHALLNKRDPRSAWAWITACWLFPLGGALLYMWFGVNRIERRARREFGAAPARHGTVEEPLPRVPGVPVEVRELVRSGRSMSGRALLAGNRVTTLRAGEEAYPDMLAAIAQARRTVWLETYIFDDGEAGRLFADAFAAAKARGVQVRVLLDGVGDLAWWKHGSALLAERGVRFAKFLPLRLFPPLVHVNLRNHHKLLTVDGERAWAGGMNISDNHYAARTGDVRTDLHFRFEGPVVRQFEDVFADNWRFAAGESLKKGDSPHFSQEDAKNRDSPRAHCRVITDGPNDATGRIQLMLLAALSNAHRRICIMTPYFIPTPELSGALQAAALRGVEIEIVLPRRSDQWWVDGATRRWLMQILGPSIHVYYRPAPFAHTKLFLMDDYYALVGSANLDPRSLRLNFELMAEVYETGFVAGLQRHFDEVRDRSDRVTPEALRRAPVASRIRDALFWLFSPYL